MSSSIRRSIGYLLAVQSQKLESNESDIQYRKQKINQNSKTNRLRHISELPVQICSKSVRIESVPTRTTENKKD